MFLEPLEFEPGGFLRFCCPLDLGPGEVFAFLLPTGLGDGCRYSSRLLAGWASGSGNTDIPVDHLPVGLRKLFLDKLHPWVFADSLISCFFEGISCCVGLYLSL